MDFKLDLDDITLEYNSGRYMLWIGDSKIKLSNLQLDAVRKLVNAASRLTPAPSQTARTSGTPVFDAMASE